MTGVIEQFGVLGVFLLMVPESACVPSEVTLLLSGFAVHQGWMSFPLALAAATSGNVVGSLLAYAVGASHVLDRVPVVRGILGRWGAVLERHSTRAVLIARLLPLARTFVSLPAGARRIRLSHFIALTTSGCALWAAAFLLAGMIAANAWSAVDSVIGRALAVIGLAVILLAAHRKRHSEESPPGVRTRAASACR